MDKWKMLRVYTHFHSHDDDDYVGCDSHDGYHPHDDYLNDGGRCLASA